jgi:hypothetical protein
MKRFVEGEDRQQTTLLPDSLEDYVRGDNPVRVIDVFIDDLDLGALGFAGVVPEATGPGIRPAILRQPSCREHWTLVHRYMPIAAHKTRKCRAEKQEQQSQ